MRIYPADIGSSCGLVTNANAQVLNDEGLPIPGLYACGNDMGSVMGGIYPAPGITLGPGMTFAYIAAIHASHHQPDAHKYPNLIAIPEPD